VRDVAFDFAEVVAGHKAHGPRPIVPDQWRGILKVRSQEIQIGIAVLNRDTASR